MAYCTIDDVRLLRLPAAPTGGTPDAKLTEHIKAADAQIDSRLGIRYVVPFTTVPELVRQISLSLAAAFFLDPTFSGGGEQDETSLSDHYRKWAEDLLDALAAGEAALPGADPIVNEETGAPSSVGVHSNYGYRPPLWDVQSLADVTLNPHLYRGSTSALRESTYCDPCCEES